MSLSPDPIPDLDRNPLVVRTTLVECDADLLALAPADQPFAAWVRRGEGIIGWGVAETVRTWGPDRFAQASQWWSSLSAIVRDDVGLPGTGLVAFGSFGFSDSPAAALAAAAQSVLVVPEVVIGRRGDQTWVTTIGRAGLEPVPHLQPAAAPRSPGEIAFADGALAGPAWEGSVAEAVRRINGGELEKVVLARDLIATAGREIDVRWPLGRLAEAYPTCWTFHVDGFFGATPELLIRRERGLVTSRVLAGTIRRTGDDDHDLALAAALARSSKDLEEHEYAVRSVVEALAGHTTSMNVPESPYVLHLPNVMHLATDVAGVVDDSSTSLDLAASLHPSAAVGGTPTAAALQLIDELESMARDRYAGPVGWMDASGDGEWGIGLRSAYVEGNQVRLFAGAGIVGDSDPAAELAETAAKFVPVRDSLGS